ncbi:MAG TPA: hypothetical protein VFE33_00460 [Thermoanaerobaculia bacterium]|nr:hypothetical protein [Thermoanaerobaculia bacterium]
MSATLLYRIAAVVLVLFALGHTFGFLHFKPQTPAGQAVRDAMNSVNFQVGSGTFTYGGFYVGFGLYVSAYLLFSAFLAWYLGGLAAGSPQAIGALGWAFFALQLASLVLSWIYFAAVPTLFSGLVAACAGWAAYLVQASR